MPRRSRHKPRWRTPLPVENSGTVTPRQARCRYSDALIAETKEVWQPYYSEPLSDEDAREIIENMIAFMSLLSKVDDKRSGRGKRNRKPAGRSP